MAKPEAMTAAAPKQDNQTNPALALANPLYEAFAQTYALDSETKGNAAASYVKCGYSPGGARQAANKLLRRADVSARIAYLRTAVVNQAVKTLIRTDIKDRLSRIDVAARVLKRLETAVDKDLTPADAPLVRETREYLKHAAIELGEWSEGPKDAPQPAVSINLAVLPPETLQGFIAEQRAIVERYRQIAEQHQPAQLAAPGPVVDVTPEPESK